jgi:hypothetical protein
LDNLASSGGSDDHHRTDGSRDSKRLMQDEPEPSTESVGSM